MPQHFNPLISNSQERSILTMFILYNFNSFIDDQVEPANSHLIAFQHALDIDDGQDIINKPALESAVEISIGSHRRATIDLD